MSSTRPLVIKITVSQEELDKFKRLATDARRSIPDMVRQLVDSQYQAIKQ